MLASNLGGARRITSAQYVNLGDRAQRVATLAALQVTLRSELSPQLPEAIAVDPERLGLVFGNLIGNAIRHTPECGTVALKVRTSTTKTTVRFEIVDTGPGIPQEYQHLIFQKFFRVPGSAAGAAGLGLSIAKEIVEAHGGEIGVESKESVGSTFYFTLPISDPQST